LLETDRPPQRLWPFLRQYMGPFRRVFIAPAHVGGRAFVEVGLMWYLGRIVDLLEATGPAGFWAAHGWELALPRSSS
jgi:ATP-binding cassette, subfamily B, multidrug efflux pump